MHELVLGLGGRSYPITIGYNFLDSLHEVCPLITSKNIVVISNKTVSALYLSVITSSLEKIQSNYIVINLPDGEQEKKLSEQSDGFGDFDDNVHNSEEKKSV